MRLPDRTLIFEFLRYAVVGGVAALADMGALALVTELVFDGRNTGFPLFVSVAVGFLVGLSLNYALSTAFVFIRAEQREKGRGLIPYLLYAAVGMVGFGMTEGLMHLGMLVVPTSGFWYLLLNGGVKCVVLVWNYIGRKIFVYHNT